MSPEDDDADTGLPPQWTRKAFVDPARFSEQVQQRASRTPCEAAWKVREIRAAVIVWLEAGEGAGPVVVFQVLMPEKVLRDAVYRRRVVEVAGETVMEAVDGLTGTVFAGRRCR